MSGKDQIRIGNQTAFSALPPTLPFEYAVANGFDTFEWFPDRQESGVGWEETDIDKDARSHIKKTALGHDIRLSVHVPWWVNPLRSEVHGVILNNLEFAQDIGAILVNIHLYVDAGLEDYAKSIKPLIRRSAEMGIRLSIENTALTCPEDFNKAFIIISNLKGVDTGHVGMCLDIGHANLCASTRNDYIRFMHQISPEVPIIHVHLHENYGDQDSHLPLFTGPARESDVGVCDLIRHLEGRQFSGSMILEQWPQPPSLLNQARDRLRQIMGYK